jgi:uncharacterized membrane protein YkvA (DUF1232 family)
VKKISDLKNYMAEHGLSPEQLASRVHISNMTLRRLLKRPGNALIPDKYQVQLGLLNLKANSPDELLTYLASQGESEKGTTQEEMDERLRQKFTNDKVEPTLKEKVEELFSVAFKSKNMRLRLVAIGALIYFINPFDLIPDTFGVLGFVDDLGVVVFALRYIQKNGFSA